MQKLSPELEIERTALEIMFQAHHSQVDKSGALYVYHPIRVGLAGKRFAERVVGFLHDVLEDSVYTAEDLLEMGIPDWMVDAVVALTHKAGETYQAYLDRVKANEIATTVKLNDIEDNMSPERTILLSHEERERLASKYNIATAYLRG